MKEQGDCGLKGNPASPCGLCRGKRRSGISRRTGGKAIPPLPSVGEGRGEGGWPPQNFGYLRGGYGLPAVALAKAGDPPRKGGDVGYEIGDTCGASR